MNENQQNVSTTPTKQLKQLCSRRQLRTAGCVERAGPVTRTNSMGSVSSNPFWSAAATGGIKYSMARAWSMMYSPGCDSSYIAL